MGGLNQRGFRGQEGYLIGLEFKSKQLGPDTALQLHLDLCSCSLFLLGTGLGSLLYPPLPQVRPLLW